MLSAMMRAEEAPDSSAHTSPAKVGKKASNSSSYLSANTPTTSSTAACAGSERSRGTARDSGSDSKAKRGTSLQ